MTSSQETRTRVNENGRVVIPAAFRKAMGINVGDEVVLRIENNELRILTLKQRIERAQRLVRRHVKPGTSLVDELIAERREAAKREKDRFGSFARAGNSKQGGRSEKAAAKTLGRRDNKHGKSCQREEKTGQ